MNPLRGAMRLALGRQDGIALFEDTPAAFLGSLAPLIAFPLVGAGLLALLGRAELALYLLMLAVVAQLGPAVVSHALACWWGRGQLWLRYATAFNWCQWALPVMALLFLIAMQLLAGDSLSVDDASQLLLLAVSLYGLWLNWVIARAALGLRAGRAVLFVLLVNVGVMALLVVPQVLGAIV